MSIAPTSGVGRPIPAKSWQVLALGVFASLMVAEYQGPMFTLAFAIAAVGLGVAANIGQMFPRFPLGGYWLVAILILGLVSAVLTNLRGDVVADIDLERDIGILISHLLFFVVGYFFATDRRTLRLILVAIITAGVAISVIHLVRVNGVFASGVTELYLFRLEAGRGSYTQFAALCSCILLRREINDRRFVRLLSFCAILVVLSMLITLSRGLMVLLIVLAVGVVGLTMDRVGRMVADLPRFAIASVCVGTVAVGAYLALMLFLPSVHKFIDEFFVARVANSFTEVSATRLETGAQITENYRAFELKTALDQFRAQSVSVQWLGQGWGSSVQFGFDTASSQVDFRRTEAAFLHNGYAYYLMKAGIIGLGLYLGFLSHLILRALSGAAWPRTALALLQRKMLFIGSVGIVLGSITQGGIGYPAGYLGLVVFLGVCFGPTRFSTADAPPVEVSAPPRHFEEVLRRE